MDQVWQALKNYIGPLLIGLVVLALLVGLGISLEQLLKMGGTHLDPTIVSLPLIAIGGVIVLMLVLCLVALAFSILGLADKDQAMGLPEGSIRAVIALSLIVLFAILSVFLYQSLITGGFLTPSTTCRRRRGRSSSGTTPRRGICNPFWSKAPMDSPSKLRTEASVPGDLSQRKFDQRRFRQAAIGASGYSDDGNNQLLSRRGHCDVGSLGSPSRHEYAAEHEYAANSEQHKPDQHTVSTQGYLIHLEVLGNNLNIITHVKLVRAGAQVVGQNVSSNPTRVSCDVDLSSLASPQGTPWDVVVDDGGRILRPCGPH